MRLNGEARRFLLMVGIARPKRHLGWPAQRTGHGAVGQSSDTDRAAADYAGASLSARGTCGETR